VRARSSNRQAGSGKHREAKRSEIEYTFVDGFAGEKYLLEIEATALINP
jgi:hypothetical protein